MLTVFALDGIPEIVAGDDLRLLVGNAADGRLQDGDIVAVTSKIVSKAEGRQIGGRPRGGDHRGDRARRRDQASRSRR